MRRIQSSDGLLYIGHMYDGQDVIIGEMVDAVVTLAPEEYSSSTDVFLIRDGEQESIDTFEQAVLTVKSYLESDTPVLVHCQSGVSRSVGVSATALAL